VSNHVVSMFEHNRWANDQLLNFCAGLGDEVLDSSLEGHYGTIREMLWHIVRGEVLYLALLTTPRPDEQRLSEYPIPPLADMQQCNVKTGEALIQCARDIPADAILEGDRNDGEHYVMPASAMFIQAIDHGTEHRTQISVILTLQGLEPPCLDGWTYLEEVLAPVGATE
jgi:uncharacterized damage-inducible protein DinB